MCRGTCFAVIVVLLLGPLAGSARAADAPATVSPGSASGELIASSCPTFSWGGVAGVESYEIVAYRLDEQTDGPALVFSQQIDGTAFSWTPPLGSCLAHGGRYAWLVRANLAAGESLWSAPNFFQVTGGPSKEQFEEALAIVQRYLSTQAGVTEPSLPETVRSDAESGATARLEDPAAEVTHPVDFSAQNRTAAESDTAVGSLAPQVAAAPAVTSLVTEGAIGAGTSTPLADLHVVGGSTLGSILLAPNEPISNESSELFFAEDIDGTFGMKIKYDGTTGANMLQIWGRDSISGDLGPWLEIQRNTGRIKAAKWNPDPPCFRGNFYDNCGNGTITDTRETLIWLENANCFPQQDYASANATAAALEDGQCGLSDGSRPGDWRLPTKDEWDTILSPGCPVNQAPPFVTGNGSCCHLVCPWATNVQTGVYWTSSVLSSGGGLAQQADTTDGNFNVVSVGELGYIWPVRNIK